MGLDAVELFLAVEDRFGIVIDDAEAANVITVGDLERLVQKKLLPQTSRACLSAFTFYHFRSALIRQLGIARRLIRPDSALEDLIPRKGRRQKWDALAREMGWRLHELRRPTLIENLLVASLVLTILVAVAGVAVGVLSKGAGWIVGLSSVPVAWLLHRATEPLAVHLPRRWATVGDATEGLLARNFGRIARDRQSWSENEMWAAIQTTIIDRLGVEPEAVTREASFRDDLRID